MMKEKDSQITPERQAEAEAEIAAKERIIDYDTKEYPVETVVEKYLQGRETDENELFIPDYQRDFIWDERRQSKFIESVLVGLPIPYVFVADIGESNGRLEVVDGSQRIRSLAAFMAGELKLSDLVKLEKLNGFRYSDLPLSRRRRFNRRTLRMIELTQKADEEVRRDIFERINTGSDVLKDMEKRRGVSDGPLIDLLEECARVPLFKELAPLGEASEKRREREEFVLRFFAYLDDYHGFDRSVRDFLNAWLERTQPHLTDDLEKKMKAEFIGMLEFVKRHFPNGFSKASGHTRTPRIRFEALSIGSALALREAPTLAPESVEWIGSQDFRNLTTSDASNSRPKLIKRIEFVRDRLLGKEVDEAEIEEALGTALARSKRKRGE